MAKWPKGAKNSSKIADELGSDYQVLEPFPGSAEDPELTDDLWMATMEEIAYRSGTPNAWRPENIAAARSALEGSSRKGVLQQQQQRRRQEQANQLPKQLDNTGNLREFVERRQTTPTPASALGPTTPPQQERTRSGALRTSVWFVGMSIDQIRKWVDTCAQKGCTKSSKASRIRLLAQHGLQTAHIAKVLNTSYQQVYQTARYTTASEVDVPEEEACTTCRRREH